MTKFRKTLLATTAAAILFAASPQMVEASIKFEDITEKFDESKHLKSVNATDDFSDSDAQDKFANDFAAYFRTNVFDAGFRNVVDQLKNDKSHEINSGTLTDSDGDFQAALKKIQEAKCEVLYQTYTAKKIDYSQYLVNFELIKSKDLRDFFSSESFAQKVINKVNASDDFQNQGGWDTFQTALKNTFQESQKAALATLNKVLPSGLALKEEDMIVFLSTNNSKFKEDEFKKLSPTEKVRTYTDAVGVLEKDLKTLTVQHQALENKHKSLDTTHKNLEALQRKTKEESDKILKTFIKTATDVIGITEDLTARDPAYILTKIQEALKETEKAYVQLVKEKADALSVSLTGIDTTRAGSILTAIGTHAQALKTNLETWTNALVNAAQHLGVTNDKIFKNGADNTGGYLDTADILKALKAALTAKENAAVSGATSGIEDAKELETLKTVAARVIPGFSDTKSGATPKTSTEILKEIQDAATTTQASLTAAENALKAMATTLSLKDDDLKESDGTLKSFKDIVDLIVNTKEKQVTDPLATFAKDATTGLGIENTKIDGKSVSEIITAMETKLKEKEADLLTGYQKIAQNINTDTGIDISDIANNKTTSQAQLTEILDKVQAKLKGYKTESEKLNKTITLLQNEQKTQTDALRVLAGNFVASGTDLTSEDFTALNTRVTNGISGWTTAADTLRTTLGIKDKHKNNIGGILTKADSYAKGMDTTIHSSKNTINTQKRNISKLSNLIRSATAEFTGGTADTLVAKIQELKSRLTLTTGGAVGGGSGSPDLATVLGGVSEVDLDAHVAGDIIARTTKYTTDTSRLTTEVSRLSTENGNKDNRISTLTGERDTAQGDNAILTTANNTLKTENTDLTNLINTAAAKFSGGSKDNLVTKIDEMQAENISLKKPTSAASTGSGSSTAFNWSTVLANDLNSNITDETVIKGTTVYTRDIKLKEDEISRLTTENEDKDNRISTLTGERDTAQTGLASEQTKVLTLTNANNDLTTLINTAAGKFSGGSKDNLVTKIDEMRAESGNKDNRITNLETELNQEKSAKTTAENERDTEKNRADNLDSIIQNVINLFTGGGVTQDNLAETIQKLLSAKTTTTTTSSSGAPDSTDGNDVGSSFTGTGGTNTSGSSPSSSDDEDEEEHKDDKKDTLTTTPNVTITGIPGTWTQVSPANIKGEELTKEEKEGMKKYMTASFESFTKDESSEDYVYKAERKGLVALNELGKQALQAHNNITHISNNLAMYAFVNDVNKVQTFSDLKEALKDEDHIDSQEYVEYLETGARAKKASMKTKLAANKDEKSKTTNNNNNNNSSLSSADMSPEELVRQVNHAIPALNVQVQSGESIVLSTDSNNHFLLAKSLNGAIKRGQSRSTITTMFAINSANHKSFLNKMRSYNNDLLTQLLKNYGINL